MIKQKSCMRDSTYIAARLRRSRQVAGFKSAITFALHHGLSVSTYRYHESGRCILEDDALANYAHLLNVSLEWLITGDKEQNNTISSLVY
ncbi:MAG: helix-turn-helix domain-containing protein [Gammaproteobacteria bacterium]|nr:helix-turn-helix domain-containing protein [Gammaproteobacteria bacterium]